MSTLRILCVHGVGHGEADPTLQPSWNSAILAAVKQWNPACEIELQFVAYDDLFAKAALDAATVTEALFKLGASGIVHSIGDFFERRRGLGDLAESLRWTAGMVAQWANDDGLRARARRRVLDAIAGFQPEVVCAHSLGSLISYDTLVRAENRTAMAGRIFVSFGSQIGNPFVRNTLGGRIKGLSAAKNWYHLFNRHDEAFTARIRLTDPNFAPVETDFDIAGFLDHDAVSYLSHANTVNKVWREIASGPQARALGRTSAACARIFKKPDRRALLVGINDYPDPQNRLEGCVNDVFLVSSVLQEHGFDAENIRVALNERATAAGIVERLEWLLDGADDGDERVFYYSGHGAQIPGYGVGEKVDRLDECLVPFDFNWSRASAVTDDQFYDLYSQLPYNAHFLAIFDCCHSGGMTRDGGLRARGLNPPDDVRHRLMKWNVAEGMWEQRRIDAVNRDVAKWKRGDAFLGQSCAAHRLCRAVALRGLPDKAYDRARQELGHHGPYLPVILQACQEQEFSYEYRHGVVSHGAFTYSLAKVLRDRPAGAKPWTWNELIGQTTRKLQNLRYDQTPALVCPEKVRRAPVRWLSSATGNRGKKAT